MKEVINMYNILQKANPDTAINSKTTLWKFVMSDETTTDTIFSAETEVDLEAKLKSLLEIIPVNELQVISKDTFNVDILFN